MSYGKCPKSNNCCRDKDDKVCKEVEVVARGR